MPAGIEPLHDGAELAVGRLGLAQDAGTCRMSYTGEPGRRADVDLAEELGVVGDGGEVERAVELQPAASAASSASETVISPPRAKS